MIVKEYFEKTRQVENNEKSKKYVIKGHRNTKYHEKKLSNKKRSKYFINFLEDGNRYRAEIFSVH